MIHLYSALLCMSVHPKHFTIMWGGGSLLNHHQRAASTWMMQRQPQDNGCSAHTSYRWRGRRVIEPIKWMGTIMALFHCMVQYGSARLGTVRLSSGRFAFPLQFSTALEWAGLFTRRYNCAASTAVTSS